MAYVACLGILVADMVGKPIDTLPPRGTLAAVEQIALHAGGCAANTAIGLARLGVAVSVLGKVGTDGEHTFLHFAGANAQFTAGDVRWPVLEDANILHVAGPFLMPQFIGQPCADVLKQAKAMGKTTALDTVWDFTGR